MRVAVQGERGCFSHMAAQRVYGAEVEIVPTQDFDELFDAVLRGRAARAVVPVENALAGAVTECLDLLVEHRLTVEAETYVRVEMCLVAPPGRGLPELRSAASHPVALRQCRAFFRAHAAIRPEVAFDTAGSIRDLMAGAAYDAAIGPRLAAELYGARVLLRGIEDHRRNYTRFFIVQRPETAGEGAAEGGRRREVTEADMGAVGAPPAGPERKTSTAFTLPHRPGALHEALGLFARLGIDVTRLESRPIFGRPWEYRFYADFRGGAAGALDEALASLGRLSPELHVLGTYDAVTPPAGDDATAGDDASAGDGPPPPTGGPTSGAPR